MKSVKDFGKENLPSKQMLEVSKTTLNSLIKSGHFPMSELVQALKSVEKLSCQEAKLNKTSMSDGKGKRITYFLTEDQLKEKD